MSYEMSDFSNEVEKDERAKMFGAQWNAAFSQFYRAKMGLRSELDKLNFLITSLTLETEQHKRLSDLIDALNSQIDTFSEEINAVDFSENLEVKFQKIEEMPKRVHWLANQTLGIQYEITQLQSQVAKQIGEFNDKSQQANIINNDIINLKQENSKTRTVLMSLMNNEEKGLKEKYTNIIYPELSRFYGIFGRLQRIFNNKTYKEYKNMYQDYLKEREMLGEIKSTISLSGDNPNIQKLTPVLDNFITKYKASLSTPIMDKLKLYATTCQLIGKYQEERANTVPIQTTEDISALKQSVTLGNEHTGNQVENQNDARLDKIINNF